jgi:hypothetical protein
MNPTTGKIYHASVNACLAPLISIDGKHVITVEVTSTKYHTPDLLRYYRELETPRNPTLLNKG